MKASRGQAIKWTIEKALRSETEKCPIEIPSGAENNPKARKNGEQRFTCDVESIGSFCP